MSSRSEVQSIDSMKKKNCWKISNRSSIPLTIHATESIIQLQSRSFASPRSQETRIEFASRGRDPDLSSLIDGTRETGGGTRRFFLSFFWRGIIGTVSCQLASRKSIGRFSALFAQGSSRITREKHLLPCKSILASARLILNLSQILLSSFLLPPPTFLYLISFSFSSLKRNYTGW